MKGLTFASVSALFSQISARRGIQEVIQFGWDMKNVSFWLFP